MRKLKALWQVLDAGDSVWSKIALVLVPVGGVGGGVKLLMGFDMPSWVLPVGAMIVCLVLAPIPYLLIDARAKLRSERQLQQYLIRFAQSVKRAVKEGDESTFNRTMESIADLDKRKADKPAMWEWVLENLEPKTPDDS